MAPFWAVPGQVVKVVSEGLAYGRQGSISTIGEDGFVGVTLFPTRAITYYNVSELEPILEKLSDRIAAKLGANRRGKCRRIAAGFPPNYDSVFEEGVQQLEDNAFERLAPLEFGTVIEISLEQAAAELAPDYEPGGDLDLGMTALDDEPFYEHDDE